MCGNDTQMSHFFDAFSSAAYSISLRGLSMLNAGSHTSTLNGYHSPACAGVAVKPTAMAPPASTLMTLALIFIPRSPMSRIGRFAGPIVAPVADDGPASAG